MNRREFVWSAACVSALSLPTKSKQIAYVGTADSIKVLIGGNVLQSHSSHQPSFLALHPNGKLLFAANDVDEYLGLPTGSVESFAIDLPTGTLKLINRQALSLSATKPRNLAISPDGRQLLVAAYAGGAYNVLPISEVGRLGPPTQILKEIGSGVNTERQASSHPHSVVFHPAAKFMIGTDAGSDRINIFCLEGGELVRRHQFAAPSGSGPGHVAIHPSGSLVFVLGDLDAVVTSYRFNPDTWHLVALRTMSQADTHLLAIHPSGDYLFTAGRSLTAWKIDHATGDISQFDSLTADIVRRPILTSDGQGIYLLEASAFSRVPFDAITGSFGRPSKLATVVAPLSLALHSNA